MTATNHVELDAHKHTSRVLSRWVTSRDGAAERIGATGGPHAAQIANVLSSDRTGMAEIFNFAPTASGFAVTDQTAVQVSTVYACMSKIAGAVLQLPVHQYRLDNHGDRERMQPTPLWWMLNEQPDDAWTAAAWKEWIIRCWALRGDQVTEILRSTSASAGGAVAGLRPLHPDCVTIRRVGYRLAYDVWDASTGITRTLDQDDVLHFSGFGFDGRVSTSVIQHAARQAVSNSLASADFSGRTVGEGAMPQIALQFPNKVDAAQSKRMRDSFVETYTGTGARKLPLVLSEGGEVKELSLSPVDLDLIAGRRYEKEDICQAFGVPPVMIGENEKTSSWGTGVEQITLGFVRFTLAPMLCRWEEEMNRKLFRRAGMFVEFNLDALLRGDSKAEADAFRAALGGPGSGDGWMSIDEIRKLKNMPALGGDAAQPFRAQRGASTSPAQPAGSNGTTPP